MKTTMKQQVESFKPTEDMYAVLHLDGEEHVKLPLRKNENGNYTCQTWLNDIGEHAQAIVQVSDESGKYVILRLQLAESSKGTPIFKCRKIIRGRCYWACLGPYGNNWGFLAGLSIHY